MGVVETSAIILVGASSAVVVGLLLLARFGFIVSPKQVDPTVPQMGRESEILREIDQTGKEFTAEFWHHYHELVAKRDNESLVPDGAEHQELIQMTDALEEWNARRMGLLFELARLRKTSIDEIMREFRGCNQGGGPWNCLVF
jgi:hypothetical protein